MTSLSCNWKKNEKYEYRIYGCVISQVVILKSELEKVKILDYLGIYKFWNLIDKVLYEIRRNYLCGNGTIYV